MAATLGALFFAAPASAGSDPGYEARGSVEQVYATGLESGQMVDLIKGGETIETNKATAEGGVLFRHLTPGGGYVVHPAGFDPSDELTVLKNKSAPPDQSIYDQELESQGYQYLETRDGTKLAINVHPPTDITDVLPLPIPFPDIPVDAELPTLIEYSGYATGRPGQPESGIAIIGNLMGFRVVDVSMRGTGCSGGAFDFFEPLQSLDGYDVVETVARQPWVKGDPGLMGISYGGISQLFVGATQPPSLAALSPVSLIDQTQTTLYPGGVLNTGFAFEWALDRVAEALPAGPDQGQPYAWDQIQAGDQTCADNQAMHGEARNLLQKIKANRHYRPKVADPLSPTTFAHKIEAPTFLACQWTDEQTGGHCPTLADAMSENEDAYFTFTNGTHVDSLAPETFNKYFDFLKLFVAKENPLLWSPIVKAGAPVLYEEAFGISGMTMPDDPIQQQPTYEAALAAFEAQQPVRILFDNGAGGSEPGQPYPAYEESFDEWPVPGLKGRSFFFAKKGKLREKKSKRPGADGFTWDTSARPATNFTGDTGSGAGGIWTALPDYEWSQPAEGNALSYVSKPLAEDTTVLGNGYVRAWVRSSKSNVDLQATVTEVRPDELETFVQGGWLRGNMRKLDKEKSTKLSPVLSLRKSDVQPLPDDRFVKVTIPLYYQGHSYRAGSRIRVLISAVGGDQPIWAFAKARPKGTADVDVAFGKSQKSKLVLPTVPGMEVPDELPPCPGLRGEPCRDYVPFENAAP